MEPMHQLADEIRDTFTERGHNIGKATDLDPAFQNGRKPQSALGRSLVVDAVQAGASRSGLECRTTQGGSLEIMFPTDLGYRAFRVLKAAKDQASGGYTILTSSDAIMTIEDEESLLPTERWVLGYTVDDDGLVDDIFAARVVGITEGSVRELVLGPATLLGGGASPDPEPRFRPSDEDDLPFGDDEEAGESDAV